jgi:hypothetical protein
VPKHGSPLRTGKAQGTSRFFLEDRPLSGGSVVELCCSGGWLTGRFEWEGDVDAAPSFYFSIEIEGGDVDQQRIELPEGALLRWPS